MFYLMSTEPFMVKAALPYYIEKSVQFSVDEIMDTSSNRIVGIELKSQLHGSLFIVGAYSPSDESIDN